MTADTSFFYERLAPYGQWFWLDPYGWVWMPNNVEVGWRPYTEGNWVYADCGWTWVSDFEWGWAPFHYGRVRSRNGQADGVAIGKIFPSPAQNRRMMDIENLQETGCGAIDSEFLCHIAEVPAT